MRERRSRIFFRCVITSLVLSFAAATWLASPALSQNNQDGRNSTDVNQDADADTGDAVGGQEVGVTGGRDVRINATNSSSGVNARTGDADGENSSDSFTGLSNEEEGEDGANIQTGDNDADVHQSASATTGDAVGGQMIGVAGASGDVTINATNVSEDVDLFSGDADSENDADIVVGLIGASNVQEGDNSGDVFQSASASSGDGVGGQLIGVQAPRARSTDITVRNESRNADIFTGDDDEHNSDETFVGHSAP